MKRSRKSPFGLGKPPFVCPIAKQDCPIKKGAIARCKASGCSYGRVVYNDASYRLIFWAIGAIAAILAIWYLSCKDGQCASKPTPTLTVTNGAEFMPLP